MARLGLMCLGGPASGHSDLGGVRRALPMAELWPGPSPSGHARGRWAAPGSWESGGQAIRAGREGQDREPPPLLSVQAPSLGWARDSLPARN